MAFGKDRYTDATCPGFNVSNRYTGQILDDDTGLYYYNARYYDPEIGRFVQADSIVPNPGDPQTLNRYSYVLNNPLKYTDPTGHENFFTGLWQAIKGAYSSPQGIVGAVLSGGVLPALIATDNYVFGQIFGQKAAAVQGAVASIVMGVVTIVAGVFITIAGVASGNGLLIAAGILTIASGVLSIASTAASLSGNRSLAEDLGWAAFGTGIAATALVLAATVTAEHAAPNDAQGADPSISLKTEIESPGPDPGVKTFQRVVIDEQGNVTGNFSEMGYTNTPAGSLKGQGTLDASVSGKYPEITVTFKGNARTALSDIGSNFILLPVKNPVEFESPRSQKGLNETQEMDRQAEAPDRLGGTQWTSSPRGTLRAASTQPIAVLPMAGSVAQPRGQGV